MISKKTASARSFVILIILCNLSIPFSFPTNRHAHKHVITITSAQLQEDLLPIRIYITQKVAEDLKKAKKWGKGMAKAFAGISHYAFDAIPFEFFTDQRAIDAIFKRLESGVAYIQETKEAFKKTMTGTKRKINQSKLAEFLYRRVVERVTVTPAQRALLEKDPLKMDEFVRSGIVKKDEYMYFTLLNFVVRYYLEQEFKK